VLEGVVLVCVGAGRGRHLGQFVGEVGGNIH
jgi:hypothetical protein